MFSVGTSGGILPPHERIIRRLSSTEDSADLTLFPTSSGVPAAKTSRVGMFPGNVTSPFVRAFVSTSASMWDHMNSSPQ